MTGYLPANFWLSRPFRSRVKSRHGTDRQTDGWTDVRTEKQTPPLILLGPGIKSGAERVICEEMGFECVHFNRIFGFCKTSERSGTSDRRELVFIPPPVGDAGYSDGQFRVFITLSLFT